MHDDSDLIDHIHLRLSDFDRGVSFYVAILNALGRGADIRRGRDWLEIGPLYLDQSDNITPPSRLHLCFRCSVGICRERRGTNSTRPSTTSHGDPYIG